MSDTKNHVDIIVLSFNTKERTLRALKLGYLHTRYPNYSVLVIDNGSTDGSREALRAVPDITLVENPINVGVTRGWNQGLQSIRYHSGPLNGRYIMLLNSDTLVALGWLETLVQVMESDKSVGIVSFGDMTNPNVRERMDVENMSFVCPLIRGEVFDDIGGFDERLFCWHSDILFCKKALAAGWRVVATPENLVYHFGESSVSQLQRSEQLKEMDARQASKISEESID